MVFKDIRGDSMHRIARLCAATAGLAVVAITAPAAMAAPWGSASSPYVASDGQGREALGFGNFFDYQAQSARSSSQQYDVQPGNGAAYVETLFQWWGPDGTCGTSSNGQYATCYWNDVSKQTPRTSDTAWEWEWRARDLNFQATAARGRVKVCQDQSWSPDACSVQATVGFGY